MLGALLVLVRAARKVEVRLELCRGVGRVIAHGRGRLVQLFHVARHVSYVAAHVGVEAPVELEPVLVYYREILEPVGAQHDSARADGVLVRVQERIAVAQDDFPYGRMLVEREALGVGAVEVCQDFLAQQRAVYAPLLR